MPPMGTMRENHDPPSTGGARGGSKSLDARICLNVCNESGVPDNRVVQGHACEVSSGAGAADNGRSHRYMYENESGGRKRKKSKKKKSRRRRLDGESAREYEERLEAKVIKDLEECYEGIVHGEADSGRPDNGTRRTKRLAGRHRSKRLAERQKRTGRHRNQQRRQREMDEARRATEDLLDRLASEGEEYQGVADRPPRDQEEKSAADRAMELMLARMRPNEQDILDRLNQVPPSSRKTRKRTKAKPVRVSAQLRAIEQAKVQRLARDWVMGGHGHMQVPKPPGHFRISLENITSLAVSNTRDRVGGIPPKRPKRTLKISARGATSTFNAWSSYDGTST